MSLGPATLRAANMASAHFYPDNIRSRAFADILPDTLPDILPAPLSTLGTAGILGGDFWEQVEYGRRQLGSAFPDIPPETEDPPVALSPSIPLLDDFWYQVENGRRQLGPAFPNNLPKTKYARLAPANPLREDFWERVKYGRRQPGSESLDILPETEDPPVPPVVLPPTSIPLPYDFWEKVENVRRQHGSTFPDILPKSIGLDSPLFHDFWERVKYEYAKRQIGSGDASDIPLLNSFWDEVAIARRQLGSFHLPNLIENALSERQVGGLEELFSLIDSTSNERQIGSQSEATQPAATGDSLLKILTELFGEQSEAVREIAKRLADSPVYSMD